MIETIVSSTLLLVAMLGAVRVEISSRRLRREAEETSIALDALKSVEATLLAQPLEELADPGGTHAPGTDLQLVPIFENQSAQYTTPGYTPGNALPRVLDLRITLSWASATGTARSLSIRSAKR